jgi:hypothetical protein
VTAIKEGMAEKIQMLLNQEPGIINMRDRYGSTPLMRGKCSVSDPGCFSRMPDPDFYPSRIQKQQQKRGVKKKFVVISFIVATNITKLKII